MSFQEVLPFPYLICFLQQEKVQELDAPLVVNPLGDSFVSLDVGPSILFLIFSLFLGALVYL